MRYAAANDMYGVGLWSGIHMGHAEESKGGWAGPKYYIGWLCGHRKTAGA